ncbi:hypothetical protein Y032_0334g2834 [Ancylostoma ceylanicum]|uniref:Uncharacterized protein n=1 Tax=Ancylostoma ceylanicum TaxID=53326 RepID=A0A016RYX8_9BILA|nr:hypothetical protein Y032_0334g2834 [Ancylostoma ceylanicum]
MCGLGFIYSVSDPRWRAGTPLTLRPYPYHCLRIIANHHLKLPMTGIEPYVYSRSKKYLPPASTARLLSSTAPPMRYYTYCDVAQSTRSEAAGKYFLERLYLEWCGRPL